MTARRPSSRQPASTGSPSGPVTVVVRLAPPRASRKPSPPSATGTSSQSQPCSHAARPDGRGDGARRRRAPERVGGGDDAHVVIFARRAPRAGPSSCCRTAARCRSRVDDDGALVARARRRRARVRAHAAGRRAPTRCGSRRPCPTATAQAAERGRRRRRRAPRPAPRHRRGHLPRRLRRRLQRHAVVRPPRPVRRRPPAPARPPVAGGVGRLPRT